MNKFRTWLFDNTKLLFVKLISIMCIVYFILWIVLDVIIGLFRAFILHTSWNGLMFTQMTMKFSAIISLILIIVILGYIGYLRWMRPNYDRNPKYEKQKRNTQKEMDSLPYLEKINLSKKAGLVVKNLNRHNIIVGTNGSGKTSTILSMFSPLLAHKQKIIFLDGKGEQSLIDDIKAKYKNRVFVWSIDGENEYNPFASRNFMSLKEKIMSLFDFGNEFYKDRAENLLTIILEGRLKNNLPITFQTILQDFIHYDELVQRGVIQPNTDDFKIVEGFDKSEITGIVSKLHIKEKTLHKTITANNTLKELVQKYDIILFSLNVLEYHKLASDMGKIIIQDVKEYIQRKNKDERVNLFLDEFNVFATDEVKNLVNKGRAFNLQMYFSYQTNADTKVSDTLLDTIYSNCQNLIIHNVLDSDTAEYISKYFGTYKTHKLTQQVDIINGGSSTGSLREVDEFVVHPNDLKNLKVGEAWVKILLPSGAIYKNKIKIELD